jgi:hypothetical protein
VRLLLDGSARSVYYSNRDVAVERLRTPGPILLLAAYVGDKTPDRGGAIVAVNGGVTFI